MNRPPAYRPPLCIISVVAEHGFDRSANSVRLLSEALRGVDIEWRVVAEQHITEALVSSDAEVFASLTIGDAFRPVQMARLYEALVSSPVMWAAAPSRTVGALRESPPMKTGMVDFDAYAHSPWHPDAAMAHRRAVVEAGGWGADMWRRISAKHPGLWLGTEVHDQHDPRATLVRP